MTIEKGTLTLEMEVSNEINNFIVQSLEGRTLNIKVNPQMIQDAIEKQIPKKVKLGNCPSCGSNLELEDCVGDDYCCNCGQHLLWEK